MKSADGRIRQSQEEDFGVVISAEPSISLMHHQPPIESLWVAEDLLNGQIQTVAFQVCRSGW